MTPSQQKQAALDALNRIKKYMDDCEVSVPSTDDEIEIIRSALQPEKAKELEDAIHLLDSFVSDREAFGGSTIDDAIKLVCDAARPPQEYYG